MYTEFAEIYDTVYGFKDYAAESRWIATHIRKHCPQARTLLEVACGTGQFLRELRGGFDVEGLDMSRAMLDRASGKLPGVVLHEGNMVDFDLGRRFDVACCLFRSIAFTKTRDNLLRALAAMARHVVPGGLVLVEPFFTPQSYWVDRVTLNEVKLDELKIAWMYVSEREGLLARQLNHVLVGTPGGVRHLTELHELGLFAHEDMVAAFEAAGLSCAFDATGPDRLGMYWGIKR